MKSRGKPAGWNTVLFVAANDIAAPSRPETLAEALRRRINSAEAVLKQAIPLHEIKIGPPPNFEVYWQFHDAADQQRFHASAENVKPEYFAAAIIVHCEATAHLIDNSNAEAAAINSIRLTELLYRLEFALKFEADTIRGQKIRTKSGRRTQGPTKTDIQLREIFTDAVTAANQGSASRRGLAGRLKSKHKISLTVRQINNRLNCLNRK